jgi:hypothetical protein
MNLDTTALTVNSGSLLEVATGGLVSLNGGLLLRATHTTLTLDSRLLDLSGDAAMVVGFTFDPVISVRGGNLLPGGPAKSDVALVTLQGTATAIEGVTGLDVGTDQPLIRSFSGPRVSIDGSPNDLTPTGDANVDIQGDGSSRGGNVIRVDTALREASTPLLSMIRTHMTTSSHVVNLFQKARVEAGSSTELVRMDRSRLDVANGHLVHVAGGSLLRATTALTVIGGSTVNILNGALVNVTGNSFAQFTGALLSFGAGTNVVNVTNSFTPNPTLLFGVVPVSGTITIGSGATLGTVFPGLQQVVANSVTTLNTGSNNRLNVTGSLVNVTPGSTLKLGS